MSRTLDDAFDYIARLEHRIANMNPVGPVAERDHEKGVRIRLGGTDEKPLLSPWIQPPDWAGTTRYLPDVGEQVMIHSHGGDWRQASLMPLTHSDEKKNPASHADEHVIYNKGKMKITADHKNKVMVFQNDKTKTTWKADTVEHEVDGTKSTLTKDGTKFENGYVRHDTRNIGKDHKHGDVTPGGGKTGDPDDA